MQKPSCQDGFFALMDVMHGVSPCKPKTIILNIINAIRARVIFYTRLIKAADLKSLKIKDPLFRFEQNLLKEGGPYIYTMHLFRNFSS